LVLDGSGRELGRGSAGPSNHQSVGAQAAQAALAASLDQAMASAGRPPLAAACFGMAGLDRPEDLRILREIADALLPGLPLELVHDGLVALVGGTGGQRYGVAVIAGTGSSAVGYTADGRFARSSGWGHLLGDEGSGFDIARRGLNAATRAQDGRGPQTILTERLPLAAGLPSMDSLSDHIYNESWTIPQVASLAPAVLAAAEDGDPSAGEIRDQAADELALAALAVIRALGMQSQAFAVILSGGIFGGCPAIVDRARRTIVREARQADVHLPVREPVWGAAWLALQSVSSHSK